MRILFDIVHPAHVHFFKHMVSELRSRGHQILLVGRDKEVTTRLLEQLGLEHVSIGKPSRRGRLGQLAELLQRDLALARIGRNFGADMIVTRNPAGVQAARIIGAVGVFDTDDGTSAGIHFRAARPFAHYITAPDCLPEDWGPRHVRYPGYKQSAYLHPDHFSPDEGVLSDLGISAGENFFVVRFVAMLASHDTGQAGMSMELKAEVIRRLQSRGRVLISCESEVPIEWRHMAFTLEPHRMHDTLAFSSLVVGDSGTVPAEAAFLGTPSMHVSTYAGRIRYLNEMESRYGLAWSYQPTEVERFLSHLDSILHLDDIRGSVASGHQRMLREKLNVAKWYVDFIERVGAYS